MKRDRKNITQVYSVLEYYYLPDSFFYFFTNCMETYTFKAFLYSFFFCQLLLLFPYIILTLPFVLEFLLE